MCGNQRTCLYNSGTYQDQEQLEKIASVLIRCLVGPLSGPGSDMKDVFRGHC